MARIDYKQHVDNIKQYLTQDLPSILSPSLDNFETFRKQVISELKILIKKIQMARSQKNQKESLFIALSKSFLFLEKLRERLLNEEIDYLIKIDDEQVKHAKLSELIPAFSLLKVRGSETFKIVLQKNKILQDLQDAEFIEKEALSKIISFYNLLKDATYENAKGEQVAVQTGYGFEVAAEKVVEYFNNKPEIEPSELEVKEVLLQYYKDTIGGRSGHALSGGDLDAMLTAQLLKLDNETKNIALQLKDLSSSKKASIMTEGSLLRSLEYLYIVFTQISDKQKLLKALTSTLSETGAGSVGLFKDGRKVTETLNRALEKHIGIPLEDFERQLMNDLTDITISVY